MGGFSIWHWLIVLAVVLLLFGRGKIPGLMGDMAKGIKAFKSGLKDEDASESASKPADQPRVTDAQAPQTAENKDKAPHA